MFLSSKRSKETNNDKKSSNNRQKFPAELINRDATENSHNHLKYAQIEAHNERLLRWSWNFIEDAISIKNDEIDAT